MTKNTTSAEVSDRVPEEVLIKDITVDPKYQTRVDGLNEETVEEYRAIYAESPGRMESIILVRINGTLYLVAGFQRIEAAKRAGCESIRAIVIDGDEETAMREALGSNKHGLKLSSGDKKKAIIMAVLAFPNYSNVMIAELIGCSESYVRKVKESENLEVRTGANPDEKVIGKDGISQARHKTSRQTASEPSTKAEESDKDEPATTGAIEPSNLSKDESASHEDLPAPDATPAIDSSVTPIAAATEEVPALASWSELLDRLASEGDDLPSLFSDIVHGMFERLPTPESQKEFLDRIEDLWPSEEEDEDYVEPESEESLDRKDEVAETQDANNAWFAGEVNHDDEFNYNYEDWFQTRN